MTNALICYALSTIEGVSADMAGNNGKRGWQAFHIAVSIAWFVMGVGFAMRWWS